jgi:hypothetical protein
MSHDWIDAVLDGNAFATITIENGITRVSHEHADRPAAGAATDWRRPSPPASRRDSQLLLSVSWVARSAFNRVFGQYGVRVPGIG